MKSTVSFVPAACVSLLSLCAALSATDRIVDAVGGPGTYPTVQAAINAALPGDRVLIRAGVYPGFSVTKSIHVLGVGTDIGDVVVGPVHLGLGFPNQNYHVSIAHLRIDAGPVAPLAVSGQELGAGQIEFESVQVEGGFRLLAGEPSFVLSMANCTVIGDIGQGFDGGTCTIAAPAPSYFTITRCFFQGARGDLFAAQPPLAGLLLDRGVTAQIEQCQMRGGRGDIAQAGAPGLYVRQAQVRSFGAGSVATGGDGGIAAAGGPGVRTTSTVQHGTVTVAGGIGTPNGPTVAGGGALLPAGGIVPELQFAIDGGLVGPVSVRPGTPVAWHLACPVGGVVLMSIAIGDPRPAPLDRLVVDPGLSQFLPADADFVVPPLGDFQGLPLFFQAVALDPASTYPATAAYAVHVDG